MLEVLTPFARGASGEEAAAALGLTPATIRTHVTNAAGKLSAHTRTHAVALAIAAGQIPPQTDLPHPYAAARDADRA